MVRDSLEGSADPAGLLRKPSPASGPSTAPQPLKVQSMKLGQINQVGIRAVFGPGCIDQLFLVLVEQLSRKSYNIAAVCNFLPVRFIKLDRYSRCWTPLIKLV